MMDLMDYVSDLIQLNGGEVTGKTRLQKIAYLLEAKDLGYGVDFDYHNFGPFSAEIAFAADDAEALGWIETRERPGFHAVPYIVFSSTDDAPEIAEDGKTEPRRSALNVMGEYSALVLELAATAVYLKRSGYPDSFWGEVKKRKAVKATPERIKSAKKLIEDLGL